MARYTCLFTIAAPVQNLSQSLVELLEGCHFEIIYSTGDYMMGREIPGQVPFSKLVTVEVLLDKSASNESETRLSFVVKNEELPLQVNNHCRQIFELLNLRISENRNWRLIEHVAG